MLGLLPIQSPVTESYVEHIGGYRFFVWRKDIDLGRATMMDRRGRVLARITAEVKVDVEKIADLDGDGHPEVKISTWSGGAHASFAYYVLSLHPKPRCLVAFWKGNGGEKPPGRLMSLNEDLDPRDLDGDDRPELVSWYDGFAYRLGAGYAPVTVPLVLKLRRGRYVEATARFPALVRRQARWAWYQLQKDLRDPGLYTTIRANAVGFLAPKIILGEEAEAWRLLRKVMPAWKFNPLYGQRSWIRSVVGDRKRAVEYPALSSLPPSWKHVYRHYGPWD